MVYIRESGFDPGLATTGYGVVRMAAGKWEAIAGGVIQTKKDTPRADRLNPNHRSQPMTRQNKANHPPKAEKANPAKPAEKMTTTPKDKQFRPDKTPDNYRTK